MKMTLSEVLLRQKNLLSLSGKKLPHKLGYAIAKNLIRLESEIKIIEKGRIDILESYAQKDEDGNLAVKNGSYELGENLDKFTVEYQDYLSTETEVDIMTVTHDEFDKMDESRFDTLTIAEIVAIDFMIS